MIAVAKKAGISHQAVSFAERGLKVPNIDTLIKIASALKIPLSEILKQAEESSKV